MAGLYMNMGGVTPAPQASYGTSSSYAPTVTQAAFGQGATVDGGSSSMTMNNPVNMAVYIGVAAVLALVLIRRSLPN
jgi:hypothetical protein